MLFATPGVHAETSESASPPAAARVTPHGDGASLGLLTTRTSEHALNPAEAATRVGGGTGSGLSLRLASGFCVGDAFALGATGGFETGLGHQTLEGQYAGHRWFLLRLEGGLAVGGSGRPESGLRTFGDG